MQHKKEIIALCEEAKNYHFFSFCVNSGYVPLTVKCLVNSGVCVCSVIGFPLGVGLTENKVNEACNAIKAGASEIDMDESRLV